MQKRPKTRVSVTIKDDYENPSHRHGINALCLDYSNSGGVLFTGGRDSIINQWDLQLEFSTKQVHQNPVIVPEKREIIPSYSLPSVKDAAGTASKQRVSFDNSNVNSPIFGSSQNFKNIRDSRGSLVTYNKILEYNMKLQVFISFT
jgi:hypothetical protein